MSPELLLPLVSSIGWLILVGAALVSYQLKWSQMVKMALVWIVIFGGLFLLVEWFTMSQGTASTLL